MLSLGFRSSVLMCLSTVPALMLTGVHHRLSALVPTLVFILCGSFVVLAFRTPVIRTHATGKIEDTVLTHLSYLVNKKINAIRENMNQLDQ